MTTVRDLLVLARDQLAAAGIDGREAVTDAEVLVREVLGWDRAHLLAHKTEQVPAGVETPLTGMLRRRASREPVSQILGRKEFWGRQFEVDASVLTPRPETELIVEECLARLADRWRPLTIADVGTGSGCLAVALAAELPGAQLVATDISAPALEVARRNVARHNLAARVRLVRTSLLGGVNARFDLIVSNPPYVPDRFMAILPPEVRDHEPGLALAGGPDGLDVVRAIVGEAAPLLIPGGWLVFEIGAGEDATVRTLLRVSGAFELETIRRDLAGIPRTVVARRLHS